MDVRLSLPVGAVDGGSYVNVREFEVAGDEIGLRDLGVKTAVLPTVDATYWFNEKSALAVQFRNFYVRGSATLAEPKKFNGATLAAGQTLNADPSLWYSFAAYYERRFPMKNPKWEWRGRAGIEYTAINFTINKGHAPLDPSSVYKETKEDFNAQELPLPTIGVEWRRAATATTLEFSLKGNWINRWNSLRTEGGTVYLSQWNVESHAIARFRTAARAQPFVGMFIYSYYQREESGEDTNIIRWTTYGPEAGVEFRF